MDTLKKTPARGYKPRKVREGIFEALNPFSSTDTLGNDERQREILRRQSLNRHLDFSLFEHPEPFSAPLQHMVQLLAALS